VIAKKVMQAYYSTITETVWDVMSHSSHIEMCYAHCRNRTTS